MEAILRFARNHTGAFLRRYIQFCIVGGSGVAVDMAVIWVLVSERMLGWNLTLCKIIAAEVAILNNFLWNELWTFRELARKQRGCQSRWNRLSKFNLICVAGIGLSVLLLNAQVYWFHVNLYVANFFSIAVVSCWNFLMNLRFGWSAGRLETAQAPERDNLLSVP